MTGSTAQIDAVAKEFHVTSHMTIDPMTSHGIGGEEKGDYRIDHSSVLYLMDGQNHLQAILPADSSPAAVAHALTPYLAKR